MGSFKSERQHPPMASRCQRSILSCSRCRKRKTKCDRQLPACSKCVAANSICTGISAGKETDVPRSIVQHLELEIARLETELSQRAGMDLDMVHASDILLRMPEGSSFTLQEGHHVVRDDAFDDGTGAFGDVPMGGDSLNPTAVTPSQPPDSSQALRAAILSGKPLQSIVSATLPNDSGARDLLSRVRMGMTPSTAQLSDGNRTTLAPAAPNSTRANKGIASNSLLDAHNLRSIPTDIIQRLMKKYLGTIQHDSPFLVAATVTQQFQKVVDVLDWQAQAQQHQQQQQQQHPFGESGQEGNTRPVLLMASHDLLVVYLVLAISVTLGSANNGHEERYMALSTALFEEGIQHFYSLKAFPSQISWLQTILLVLLYATVFPRSANVWVLSGAAMRACLELGLHREPPEESLGAMDSDTLDLRRRVFWAAYCMDRSICSALQRPLSTPDTAINTKVPAMVGDDDTFLGTIEYHKLLSEMLHVHFQRESLPDNLSWDEWVAGMENRLRAWHEHYGGNYDSASSFRPQSHYHEMIEFNMARGLMILHRPSPRAPSPTSRSLLIAFESASAAARMHSEHVRAGFFRRPWLSAHHTLEAATVVLFCLRHGSTAIAEGFSPSQVFEMTKLFTSTLLSIAAQGWPEVTVYASVYERLLAPLLERVILRRPELSDAFGPAQDAELVRLLYPGPAHIEKLRFGWRQLEEELSPFDFNLFMLDDFENWGQGAENGAFGTSELHGQRHHDERQWDVLGLHGGSESHFQLAL